jgi:hypothetical protein
LVAPGTSSTGDGAEPYFDRRIGAGAELLAEGALRADFRATDAPALILMFSRLAHTDRTLGPALARRYLELLLNGLAPAADRGPVEPALDDDALGGWLTALARAR